MSILRNTVGTALAGAAQGLNVASKLLDATAKTLRPGSSDGQNARRQPSSTREAPPQGSNLAATADEATDNVRTLGRVSEPPATPVLDETPHLRTSESHIAELADKPASEVIEAVSGLSTDELRLLTEFEADHKNRSTVLKAIEKAVSPSPSTSTASRSNGAKSGKTRASSSAKRAKKGEQREIVLPEAGGVPTSGSMDASKA